MRVPSCTCRPANGLTIQHRTTAMQKADGLRLFQFNVCLWFLLGWGRPTGPTFLGAECLSPAPSSSAKSRSLRAPSSPWTDGGVRPPSGLGGEKEKRGGTGAARQNGDAGKKERAGRPAVRRSVHDLPVAAFVGAEAEEAAGGLEFADVPVEAVDGKARGFGQLADGHVRHGPDDGEDFVGAFGFAGGRGGGTDERFLGGFPCSFLGSFLGSSRDGFAPGGEGAEVGRNDEGTKRRKDEAGKLSTGTSTGNRDAPGEVQGRGALHGPSPGGVASAVVRVDGMRVELLRGGALAGALREMARKEGWEWVEG